MVLLVAIVALALVAVRFDLDAVVVLIKALVGVVAIVAISISMARTIIISLRHSRQADT